MAMWKTTFERVNFGFRPTLTQTAEVIFEADIPFDDDHIGAFCDAAWDAMWEQNPQWRIPKGPIEGGAGWSSVMGGHEFTEVRFANEDDK